MSSKVAAAAGSPDAPKAASAAAAAAAGVGKRKAAQVIPTDLSIHKRKMENNSSTTAAISTATTTAAPCINLDLWDKIVCYLDIPTLGTCAQVSKEMKAAAAKDPAWEHHLKKLLRLVFDGAFYFEPKERARMREQTPVRLSKRPLKSTNFRSWYVEWSTAPVSYYTMWKTVVRYHYKGPDGEPIDMCDMAAGGEEESYHWLVHDVPLRSFYKEAGHFAWMGELQDRVRSELDDEDGSDGDSDGGFIDYDGVHLGRDRDLFRGLPNLRVFHGHY
jgi:hypothetical protein